MNSIFRLFPVACICFFSVTVRAQTTVLQKEALAAIRYLNAIRQNPPAYADSTDTSVLKRLKAMPALRTDSILMAVALEKARDMAERDYFEHTNRKGEGINIMIDRAGYTLEPEWLKSKSQNNFESISAGKSTGIENINLLIKDPGVNPPYHRNHLLGLEPFWAACTDIGIGFVHRDGTEYGYYMCVIIARRNW